MKKVKLKEYRQYAALVCGLFAIAGGIFMLIIYGTHFTNISVAKIMDWLFVLIAFFTVGFVNTFYSYRYPKTGINEIIINDSNIIISAYNEETKKEYILDLPKSDILSCNVAISYQKGYEVLPSRDKRMDIVVEFSIECLDNINHKIVFHTVDYRKIKQIFGVAKDFPNFSYKIDTNSPECQENILNLAKTGKNLSLKQYFKTYFANPKVPDIEKTSVKCLFLIIILSLFVVVLMIISIVRDILRY